MDDRPLFSFPGSMFFSETSVSGFAPQQLSALAAMSGQPAVANGQAIPGMFDPSVLLSSWHPNYVRQSHNTHPSSSVLQSSSIYPTPGPMEYSFTQPVEQSIAGRQFNSAALASYPFQQFGQPGSTSQPLTLPYGHSISFLCNQIPSAPCSGGPGHLPQYHQHPQAALVATAAAAPVRTYDSLKHFGALPLIQQNRRNKPTITSKTNLYISGLSESDTDDTVRSLVENIVQPKSCKAMVKNGKCQGYGFIDCASEEDAEKAKNHIIECAKVTGRKLSVTFAYENEKDLLNVYVQHLPRVDFTKEKLEDMFQKYGQVTSVKLMEADNGLTGCGFVRFASAEQAKKAVEQMNEAKLILGNNDKPVACKLADKADTRRRTLAATQAAAAAMLQPQQTLGNQLHRQNLPVCNSASPQAVSMPQTQTQPLSPYGQGVPVAPQSLPPLQQSHVAVPSMTSLASPHSRGVLAPSVLPNGSCPSAVGPMSFSSLVLGALNPHGSNISHRATPLIGPPPHPQVPAGLQPQQNPNLVAAYAAAMDANQGRAKTATGVQSTGYPNVTAGSVYLPNGGSIGSPSILNSSQPLPYLNSVPSNMQYPTHYAQQQPQQTLPAVSVNPSNPHLLVLAQPSATCTYQQPVSNALSTCSMNQIAQQYALMSPTQTTSMPKSAGLQHAAVVYQQQAAFMANQECSNSNNVNLVTSEFQSMTLNMPASANRPMPPASAPQLSLCANESVSWKGCPAVEVSRSAEPQSDPISVAFQPAPGSVGPAGDVQFSVCDRDCVSASAAQTPMFEHCEQAKNLSSGHCCSNSPLDTSALARSLSSASNSDDAVTGAQAADVISTSSTRLSPHPCNTSISGDNYEQNGSTSTDQRGVEGVWTKKYNRMIRKKHESPTTSASRGRRRSESGLNDGRATLAHMNSNRRRKLVASNSSRTGESVNGNEIDLLQSTNRMTEPNPTKQLPTTCPSAPAAPQSTLP